ncbi:MAG: conjugal transfer protein TraX [Gloeocapsa sp. UFS-A4-WI-NPMV-4B04]|jgi:hypothetical protein|nr:conjugal transfer protein TraX [Gloeocapsa sp. UFS-A4-WI-NPMV-4B04]
MTTFQIKLLAAVLMVCDHIGAVIFPKILILRFLGRLSFPLFAWLIGQGEKHTNNFNLYLLRLVILGLISQPIYYLTFHSSALNILATLAFGLLAIRVNKVIGSNLFTLIFAALAQLANAEYGAYGVFVIILLSEMNINRITWWLKWISLNLLTFWLPGFFFHQFLAGLTPLILSLWNSQQGRKGKWFYPFYPVHLALILVLQLLIL